MLADKQTNDIAGDDDGEFADLLDSLATLDGTEFGAASVEESFSTAPGRTRPRHRTVPMSCR
ncbi:hypothetical protein [Nesterenkonia sandarakina]|uniref:Uncharacterized protein n=1 Tax=Nesterenkonia sandarakina TaxID=272918 RepID=A0A7Z0E619_9MICC|nr:hypothetical protein [Nesterenkonia sandarakina]NYJ15723.1 hypothetical protein [Nesterenkonia sandarakina]